MSAVPASYTDRGSQSNITSPFTAGLVNITTRDNVSAGATGGLTSTAASTAQGESCGTVIHIPASGGSSIVPLLLNLTVRKKKGL
jgi:hypothetical protein